MMFLKNTLQFPKTQKYARLLTTEPETWLPKKRVSRMTMDKIRALNASQPEIFNSVKLSEEFKLSVEAIRRILKSKYQPLPENAERQEKNRYEAMGERRSQFQNEYNANKKVVLEKLYKEAPDNSITKRKEVKDTWRNESITRAGWKSDEVKDTRRSRDGERREWSERQDRRPMADESQYNTRRSSFSRDRDGNDGRWRNDNYNNKEKRSDRPFEDRRRESFGDRNNDNNRSWRNDNNNQRERRSDRPFEDRKRESFRDRDDGNNRNWRSDNNNQRERRSDRPFEDRKRESFRDRDDGNNRSWRNDSSNQRERQSDRPFEDRRRESFRDRDNGNNRNWKSDKYNQRGRRNSRTDDLSDDKRRNESFRAKDTHRENGSRDGKESED